MTSVSEHSEEIRRIGSQKTDSWVWRRSGRDAFSRSTREEDDEEALRWAVLEKLPTYDRVRRGMLMSADGNVVEVNMENLAMHEKRALLERLVRVAEDDNEKFLLKLKNRIDRSFYFVYFFRIW